MKSYTIVLTLNMKEASDPLQAAKYFRQSVIEDGSHMIYDVIDEETKKAYTVELGEYDGYYAVLENGEHSGDTFKIEIP
jgi:hypothetical protein